MKKNPLTIIHRQRTIISQLRERLQETHRAEKVYKESFIQERQKSYKAEEKLHYLTKRLEAVEAHNKDMQYKYHERLREAFQQIGR